MTPRLPKAALLFVLPLLSAPALAIAQSEPEPMPEPAPETEKVEEAKEEKKICKRLKPEFGSRRSTKVCKTKDEWKAYNRAQRDRQY